MSADYPLPREEQIEVFEALERAGTKIREEEFELEKRAEIAVSSLGVQTKRILGLCSVCSGGALGGALLLQSNVVCSSVLLFFVLSSLSIMAGFSLSMLVALRKMGQLKRPLQLLRRRRLQLGRELLMLIEDLPVVDEHDLEAGVKFQPIEFLGRLSDLKYIIANPSDVSSQFTSLLIWMAIIAGLHAMATPLAAFFIFCYRENDTILWMANFLAITGPIGKEGADLWPRIASASNATIYLSLLVL